jgi:protein-L-isoaspartate(D-aspartate) O-methyltransferase
VNGFASRRDVMVRRQLEGRGITDPAVLAAFRVVPREAFVPAADRDAAYEDHPLPIGAGQTISQPYVVALMVESLALQPTDHVLEVGAGSGYAAAVMSRIAADVVAVERIPELAEAAAVRLEELGYANVHVVTADGSTGVAADAPFDAVCVSAGAPSVPTALVRQLAPGGRLVVPVGAADGQDLWRVVRRPDGHVDVRVLGPVRFVPLMGEQGWHR